MTLARKIVFLGDCQANVLARMYHDFVAPHTKESISFVDANGGANGSGPKALAAADVVVSQVFNLEKKLTVSGLGTGVVKIEFPALFLGFLWPFAAQAPHVKNAPTPAILTGPYPAQLGDTFLNKLILARVSAEEALKRYLQLDIARAAHLDRLMELHLEGQVSRDKRTGFSFAQIIEARFRDTCLFVTPHHPALPLAIPLIWDVFERLNVSRSTIEAAVQSLRVHPFPKHALPIHPGVISHFGLRYTDEEAHYPHNEEGSFTFHEYVLRYMKYSWNKELYEGITLARGSDLQRAHTKLQRALRRSASSIAGWQSMSVLLRRMARPLEAKSAAERSIALDPADPGGRIELARALLALDDLVGAEEAAEHAISMFPADGRSHHVLAEVRLKQGRTYEALLSAKRATALRPGDRTLYGLLGHLLVQGRDWAGAEAAFREADQAQGGFRLSLAQALFNLGKDEEAIATLQERIAANDPHTHALLGHIKARRNDLPGAEAAFRKALELRPSLQSVRGALANVLARIEKSPLTFAGDEKKLLLAQEMTGKPRFSNRDGLLSFAIRQLSIPGLIMEFGVFSGHTINLIAKQLPDRQVYGFDSFKGLPEAWDWAKAGHFARDSLPSVRDNVELIVGWFEDTVPAFLKDNPGKNISMIHVDCDLYSSTRTILDKLGDCIVPGTIIVFDEYWNYKDWRKHGYKAFQEFVTGQNVNYTYIGYTEKEQVAVRITSQLDAHGPTTSRQP